MLNNIHKYLRLLAKSKYYQTIYSHMKEIDLQIFQNNIDLTMVQIDFIRYLAFYSSIMLDIALDEVSEKVLDSEINEDSYALWKSKKDTKKNKDTGDYTSKDKTVVQSGIKWNFKNNKTPVRK